MVFLGTSRDRDRRLWTRFLPDFRVRKWSIAMDRRTIFPVLVIRMRFETLFFIKKYYPSGHVILARSRESCKFRYFFPIWRSSPRPPNFGWLKRS